ncbi:hypothetical protein RZS08_34295, partial [Arthrospira platensis SPKY1]|nr:hypothetical protein [Arthrospira platensis SPKY1]
MDFYIKTIGRGNLYEKEIRSFPLGVKNQFIRLLINRSLSLQCGNKRYADLWNACIAEAAQDLQWSKADHRLVNRPHLPQAWSSEVFLRTYYERRQALVEIDVLVAMAFGLTLE